MDRVWKLAVAGLAVAGQAAAFGPFGSGSLRSMPWSSSSTRRSVGPFVVQNPSSASPDLVSEGDANPNIKVYNFSVPVDHFHNESVYEPHSHDSFPLRYWLDASYYKPGGPVFVLLAGETSGEDRIPFLDHGILPILSKATGGVSVVLEHRYYGTSFPVPDLTVENLRFLTTEQALADTAYFARHVQFPDLKDVDLTAPHTPWISYGGSYAGAFAALLRKIYPNEYMGSIASSSVTAAVNDYWEYLEAARLFAPGDCGPMTQKLTQVVDSVLFGGNEDDIKTLKDAFSLTGLQNDEFGSVLSRQLDALQGTNWVPSEDYTEFGKYCAIITSRSALFPSTSHLRKATKKFVSQSGSKADTKTLVTSMLNYIGYIRDGVLEAQQSRCQNLTNVECFSIRSSESGTGLYEDPGRAWDWQKCNQWGYYVTGSGVPKDQLSMKSRAVDLDYLNTSCRKFFNITTPPNVESINKYGGLKFSFPRLAFVDGRQDPWRAAGPHAIGLPDRKSTPSEPFILLDPGVHHWDEYGLRDEDKRPGLPPKHIVDVQNEEVKIVKHWLKEWRKEQKGKR